MLSLPVIMERQGDGDLVPDRDAPRHADPGRDAGETVGGREQQCRNEQRCRREHQHVRLSATEIGAEQTGDAGHRQEHASFLREAREQGRGARQATGEPRVSEAVALRRLCRNEDVVELR
jgi:hypothetical protein